jgi:hypothetical protein
MLKLGGQAALHVRTPFSFSQKAEGKKVGLALAEQLHHFAQLS